MFGTQMKWYMSAFKLRREENKTKQKKQLRGCVTFIFLDLMIYCF